MSETEMSVSVIVPVYNAEPYIERCIEALRGQTLGNMEFIFVDDCGQDRSMAIVERHAVEDGRIRIVRNERNVGPGPSRNAGMAAARGEYLGFADPDDWMATDFYELLYAKAKEGDFDIVKGSMAEVRPDASGEDVVAARDDLGIEKKLAWGRALYGAFYCQHWTALYRRALVETSGALYGLGRASEDLVFQLRICHAARRFALEDRAVYFYFQHAASATHKHDPARYDGDMTSLTEIFDFLVAHAGEGVEIYRYADEKLRFFMKMHRDVFPLYPELRAYAREHQRRLRELALRLPDTLLLLRVRRQLTIPVFRLFGINLYAWEGALKRMGQRAKALLKCGRQTSET